MTRLERYRQGEHETVWAELNAMGDAVRSRKIRDDAEAVARETMRRARRNIETLLARLRQQNYPFQDPNPFRPAARHAAAQIKLLEKKLNGRLPLSLAAWWLEIDHVSFLAPEPTPYSALVFAPIAFALESLEDWTPSPPFYPPKGAWQTSIEAWRRSLRKEGLPPEQIEAQLAPAIAEFEAQDVENERLRAQPFDPRFRFPFAPDARFIAGVAGGTVDILLPNPAADFPLEGAPGNPLFTHALRSAFRPLDSLLPL